MKKILFTVAGLFLSVIIFSSSAASLTPEQKRVFQSGIHYFNLERTSQVCTATTNLAGSDNAEKIYNYLVSKGFKPYQAAGIMGNLQAESGLNPKRVQNTRTPQGDRDNVTVDGRTGYGLAQWTSRNRQQGLADLAASRGVISGDLGVQLDYLMQELEGPYRGVYEEIKNSQNLDQASDIFMTKFERPKDQSESAKEKRRAMGRAWLAQFGSNDAAQGSSGGVVCQASGSGDVRNGYSLPVDRKWYDQHPEWFSKPHHDYPAADIPVPTGTPIYAVTAGKVINAPTGGNCGTGLVIDAGNGAIFTYCHGSDGGAVNGARQGDTVQAGQLIMHSANTGRSTGPHLHLGISVNGQNRCPQPLLTGIANGNPPSVSSLPSSGCTN